MLVEPTPVRPKSRIRLPLTLAVVAGLIGVGAFAIAATIGPRSAGTAAAGAPANAALDQSALDASPGDGAWQAPAAAPNQNVGGRGGARGMAGLGMGGPGIGGGRGWMMGGAITITKIDGSKLSLSTVDGWTRTIDATGATVQKSGKTIAVSDLAIGDQVAFREARQSDGTFKITAITVVLPRVSGTVKSVSGSALTITLRDGTTQDVQLNGSTSFSVDGQAADKSAVTVGAQVTVEGTKATDGTFTATTVTVAPNQLVGSVTATSTGGITVKSADGTAVTVTVDAKTTYRVSGVTTPALKDVAVGSTVMVVGLRTSNTAMHAISVWAGKAGAPFWGPASRGDMNGLPWSGGMHPFGKRGPAGSPSPSAAPSTSGA